MMEDKLCGWEKILEEFGYIYNCANGSWENFDLQSSYDQRMIYEYFSSLEELTELLTRLRDDPEFRAGVLRAAWAMAEAFDQFAETGEDDERTVH